MGVLRKLIAVIGLAACGALAPAAAQAAVVFHVNTTADGNDFNTADPFCDADAGTAGEQCTLRAAIQQAATPPGRDTIDLPAGTYTIDSLGGLSDLVVDSDVIVEGAGPGSTVVRQNQSSRIFRVAAGGRLDLRDVTVRDGVLAAPGGGIRNDDTLILRGAVVKANNVTVGFEDGGGVYGATGSETTILDSVIGDPGGGAAGNRAERGGGVFVDGGLLTVRRSSIEGNTANSAIGAGGGVYSNAGPGETTVIEDSALSGNSAPSGSGGALMVQTGTLARAERVTISGNDADDAAVYTNGVLALVDVTISGNTAYGSSEAGMRVDTGSGSGTSLDHVTFAGNGNAAASDLTVGGTATITVHASIFASAGTRCIDFGVPAAIISLGGNVEVGNDCGLDQPSDRPNANPGLGPLADNGGPTLTRALPPGSPAVDLVPGFCLATDQRGVPSPRGARCDSGAYELARCRGVVVNRVGTPGPDRLFGTASADGFLLLGGNDTATGRAGNDAACGGRGADRFYGRQGRDTLLGDGGGDVLFGGPGADLLLGGAGLDRLIGGPGNDRGFGGAGRDRLFGKTGRDRLVGQGGPDLLFGGGGPDLLLGGAAADRLFGGPGRDTLRGLAGRPDRCFGGPGADRPPPRGCERTRSIP